MIRRIEKSDYDDIKAWWEGHGHEIVPPDRLPVLGLIIPGLACGYLYRTDSRIAFAEWLTTNPHAPTIKRARALRQIAIGLQNLAKEKGFNALVSIGSNEGVLNLGKQLGFTVKSNASILWFNLDNLEEGVE